MVPELLILALDFYRAPLNYPQLVNPDRALPESFDNLIGAFAVALSPGKIEATARALGTSAEVVDKASSFFLRQVLLVPGGSHYRVLGLSPDASEADVREHYQLLVRVFHPDRSGGDPGQNAEYTARINDAYNTLKRADARERYDRQLGRERRGRRATEADLNRFHPHPSMASKPAHNRKAAAFGADRRRMLWVLAGAGFAVALLLVVTLVSTSTRPVLRTNPELGNASIAEPSFLRERSLPEAGSSPAQQPAVSRMPAEDGPREASAPMAAVRSAARPAADFPVGTEPAQRADDAMSRDLIRDAAIMAPAPQPGFQLRTDTDGIRTDTDGSGGQATRLPVAGGLASGPPTAVPAGQMGHAASPAIKEASSPMASAAPSAGADGAGRTEPKVVPSAPEPSAGDDANPSRLAQAEDKAAVRATEGLEADAEAAPEKKERPASAEARTAAAPPPEPREKLAKIPATKPADTGVVQRRDKGGEKKPAKTREPEPEAKTAKPQKPAAGKSSRGTGAPLHPPPGDTITRLIGFYRAGNIQGLVGLFTADASVTGGKGRSAIRSDYAGLFARTSDRRLSIDKLDWRRAGNGSVIGVGSYRARTKASPGASWRYSTGTMRIKLVPQQGSYKIAELYH